jgi:hypothetical protein
MSVRRQALMQTSSALTVLLLALPVAFIGITMTMCACQTITKLSSGQRTDSGASECVNDFGTPFSRGCFVKNAGRGGSCTILVIKFGVYEVVAHQQASEETKGAMIILKGESVH